MTAWREEDAEQATFLAIVPPQPVSAAVLRIQWDAEVDTTVEPHVTVKAQPGLADPTRWLAPVEIALAEVAPFVCTLGGVGWFGDGIVYLEVAAPEVTALHLRILDALLGAGIAERFEYDGDAFHPHLTLGASFAGASPAQLQTLADAAANRVWQAFPVTEIGVFQRLSPGVPYRRMFDVPLGGGPRRDEETTG